MQPNVIFEDEHILVLDKPAGMIVNKADTTVGQSTVQEWVEGYVKVARVPQGESPRDTRGTLDTRDTFYERAGIVHRLDKETSGILLVAKTVDAFVELQRQFKEREVKKTYLALAHGKVVPTDGIINVPVGRLPWNRMRFGVVAGGRDSLTRYKVIRYLEVGNGKLDSESLISRSQDLKNSSSKVSHFSLLELYPETGRTHQIRVHLKHIGYPIFGDALYAGRKTARDDRKILSRVFLHAAKISFFHPESKKELFFESPLPEELGKILPK